MDDVRTILRDSGLSHSYWAEAAAYSIDTRNLIPSHRHPGIIPLELFSGKRQSVTHLRVFGAKYWAKILTVNGAQVSGGSKLDPRSIECRFLGYASTGGNYKVQDVTTRHVLVSRDVVFEEGHPRRTLTSVGEQSQIQLFETDIVSDVTIVNNVPAINDGTIQSIDVDQGNTEQGHQRDTPEEPWRSSRTAQPSQGKLQSSEYKQWEVVGRDEGHDWATDKRRPNTSSVIALPKPDCDSENPDYIACRVETKASHRIPQSYRHAMVTNLERWMMPMQAEMDTLKAKHTWDLVKPPPGANIMGSMWVYNIKWDEE
jgi:hypothetical protein